MKEKAVILDEKGIARAVARISYEIIERNRGTEDLCIIGILTRGGCLADRIAAKISEVEGKNVPVGYLDISPYRDDAKRTTASEGSKTEIGFETKGKKIVLVDDVIYTGRSVRAAIDGLMAMGRPHSIQLAVLVDRGHRELPIRADYVGKNLPTSRSEAVQVLMEEKDGVNRVSIYDLKSEDL